MPSMRTLNRRLDRWRRYARRTCWNPRVSRPRCWGPDSVLPPGLVRAWNAQQRLSQRRADRARDLNFRAWNDYDPRCCIVGDVGHPGPCVTRCSYCAGTGRCPLCGGEQDFCGECSGDGYCPYCDEGEVVVDDWIPPRTVVTIDTGGLT